MAKDETNSAAAEPKIEVPGLDREITISKARSRMERLTEEAASLREDESPAARSRRTEIASQLRAIQAAIDKTEEIIEVTLDLKDTVQWPFRINGKEFWPGTHQVRTSVAQVLRHMVDQHRQTEGRRLVAGGNTSGYEDVGRTYPPSVPREYDHRGKELPPL